MIHIDMGSQGLRIFGALGLFALLLHLLGVVLAAAFGPILLRTALGRPPTPLAGALEAGGVASLAWVTFYASGNSDVAMAG